MDICILLIKSATIISMERDLATESPLLECRFEDRRQLPLATNSARVALHLLQAAR